MAVICQHCGTEAPDDRVMCPNCRRRMRPSGEVPQAESATQPAAVVAPEPATAPEPAPAAAPAAAYGAPEPSPWDTPDAAGAPEPPRPQVLFARDVVTKSNRLTVAFRIFLAIPQLIVLWALNFALEIMGLIGWFAALFTKRLPDGVHEFIVNILRYQVRVGAYVALLTDRYPPFGFGESDYDVQYRTTQETMNRAAVFFRIILVIPAAGLAMLVAFGYALALIVTWFIVLILGRMPEPLFEASAGVQRYLTRVNSYFWLVAPAYPAGLFNDSYTEAYGLRPNADDQGESPRQTSAVKRLLVTFLVIGALVAAGIGVAIGAATAKQIHALNDLRKAHNVVTTTVQLPPCTSTNPSAQLTCLRGNAQTDAGAFRTFEGKLQALHFNGAQPEKQQLLETTDSLVRAFGALSLAQTPEQFNQLEDTQHLQSLLNQWDNDYQHLDDAVAKAA